jgi:hypothetical protein
MKKNVVIETKVRNNNNNISNNDKISNNDDSDDEDGKIIRENLHSSDEIDDNIDIKEILVLKNKEIEKLKIILQAVEPLPGLNIEKYRKFFNDGLDNGFNDVFDFRDSKIIDLSKKIRNLNMKLNKSNALNEKSKMEYSILTQKFDELMIKYTKLQEEDKNKILNSRSEIEIRLQKDLNLSLKTIEDYKLRLDQSINENKNFQRLLRSEIGENFDQISEEGWKGRAQQIERLKIKVKRYENMLKNNNNVMTNTTTGSNNLFGTMTLQQTPEPETRVLNDIAGI